MFREEIARIAPPSSFQWARSDRMTPSCSRLEKGIANRKPAGAKTDPATDFWTVYMKVAEEHDSGMVSRYAGDLDASLLFVSAFISLAHFIPLNQGLFRARRVYSRPLLPHSLP